MRRPGLGRGRRRTRGDDLDDVRRPAPTSSRRTGPVLDAIAGNVFHVGDRAGQGQAMKLLNNFLSATALAATSEAIAFGVGRRDST